MLSGAPVIGFVASSDLARSRRFYQELLGWEVEPIAARVAQLVARP
jgi:predicted enzyme related to lactoylglutathione lyase